MVIEIGKISPLDSFNQILIGGEVLGDQVFDTFECFCQTKNKEIGSLLLIVLDKMLPNSPQSAENLLLKILLFGKEWDPGNWNGNTELNFTTYCGNFFDSRSSPPAPT